MNVVLTGLFPLLVVPRLWTLGRAAVAALVFVFGLPLPLPFPKNPLRAPVKEGFGGPDCLQSTALCPIPLHLKQRVLASNSCLEIRFPLPEPFRLVLASRPFPFGCGLP